MYSLLPLIYHISPILFTHDTSHCPNLVQQLVSGFQALDDIKGRRDMRRETDVCRSHPGLSSRLDIDMLPAKVC